MTDAQRRLRELRERQSKSRQRMAELSLVDELTDEQRSELDTIERGTPDLERQILAAVVAVGDEDKRAETLALDEPDREMRERIELRSKASLCSYLRAALWGQQVSGAEAELRSAAGVTGIPLELWDTPAPESEQRAATEAPGTVGLNLDRIRPHVFANSIAPRLGFEMPRVASGTYASATITTSLTAGPKAKGADADATAAAFTVTSVTPKRISARLTIQIEDIAAVGQANFESVLRENLSLALSDELDDQAINGDRPANPTGDQVSILNGIFKQLTNTNAPAAVADFTRTRLRMPAALTACGCLESRTWGSLSGRTLTAMRAGRSRPRPISKASCPPPLTRWRTPAGSGRTIECLPPRRMCSKQFSTAKAAQCWGRREHAHRRLRALQRGVDRRYLQRLGERDAAFHHARFARRRDPGPARRLFADQLPASLAAGMSGVPWQAATSTRARSPAHLRPR